MKKKFVQFGLHADLIHEYTQPLPFMLSPSFVILLLAVSSVNLADTVTDSDGNGAASIESSAINTVADLPAPTIKLSDASMTVPRLSDSESPQHKESVSSFIQRFDAADFLAPLRKAAEEAKSFAKKIREHGFFRSTSGSSLLQNDHDAASQALSEGQKALKKLNLDLSAEKEQLSSEIKDSQEGQVGERAGQDLSPSSFLQIGKTDYKMAAADAIRRAKKAEAAWEASRKRTDSLLAKVHDEITTLNQNIATSSAKDHSEISMLEDSRKNEDIKLRATEDRIKALSNEKITLPSSSFLQTTTGSTPDDILAPLRKAGEEARHFADEMRKKIQEKLPSSLLQSENAGEKAARELSLAEKALKKVDEEIAAKRDQIFEEEKKLKEKAIGGDQPASFLQVGRNQFNPFSPQGLADWKDKFELQLQKAREAAGIHTPMHSSFSQIKEVNFAENDQLKEDERQVERLENQYNQKMQKLKEDNAELLARAKEEVERAKDEENKVKSQLAQSSFLELGRRRFNKAEEKARIENLEKKWIKEAQVIVTPQNKELQELMKKSTDSEMEAEARLAQAKQKVQNDMEVIEKDIASVSPRPASFLQTHSKDPAGAALARAEADLRKLKKQLREESAKLSAMHFSA